MKVFPTTLVFLMLCLESLGFARNSPNYNPGLDLSLSAQQGTVTSSKPVCRSTGTNTSECWQLNESMAQSDSAGGIYLEKTFDPQFRLGIFIFDYGLGLGIRNFKLTNGSENQISVTSTTSDGTVIADRPFSVDLDVISINPYVYSHMGMMIPYLPWIVVTTGVGYQGVRGKINVDSIESEIVGHATSFNLEFDIIWLRTSYLWLHTYFSAFPTGQKVQALNDEGKDFGLELSEVGLGLKFHFLLF